MSWERQGDCPPERCQGRCCRHFGIWITDPGIEMRLFLKSALIRGLNIKGKDGNFLIDLPFICQYLTDGGLCALHPDMRPAMHLPKRPAFCDDWPTEPAQLINDDCGFSFIWKEEPVGVTNG